MLRNIVFMGKCAIVHENSLGAASKDFNDQRVFALIMNCEYFMRVAIEDAKRNGHHFGAVVVKNNEIIAKAGKMPKGDSRFHAETHAILEACEKLRTRNLENCILYSTCEPCPMCFYMAWVTKVSKIVYGATIRDCIELGIPEIRVTAEFLNKRGGNKIELKKGVLAEDCLKLLAR